MTKTLVDIPDDLMADAQQALGPKTTKAQAVRQALVEMVQRHRQLAAIDWLETTDALGDLADPEVKAAARR